MTPRAFATFAASAALVASFALLLLAGVPLRQAGAGSCVAMLVAYAASYAVRRPLDGVPLGEACDGAPPETPTQSLVAIASLAAFAVVLAMATT